MAQNPVVHEAVYPAVASHAAHLLATQTALSVVPPVPVAAQESAGADSEQDLPLHSPRETLHS